MTSLFTKFARWLAASAARTIAHLPMALAALTLCAVSARVDGAPQEKRVGLIIANTGYGPPLGKLLGPVHDASVIETALSKQGFVSVDGAGSMVEFNRTKAQIEQLIAAFKKAMDAAGPDAIGFIYYAGHGTADKSGTDNLLLPIDVTDAAGVDISSRGVAVGWITKVLREVHGHPKMIIVVDACRTATDAPGSPARTQFVRPPAQEQPLGMLLALSTSERQSAKDEGPYADVLSEQLGKPGLGIADVFERVKVEVAKKTGNAQIPIHQSQIVGTFCLAGCAAPSGGNAMESFKTAIDLRPAGDSGQIAAIQQLAREDKTFSGLDLSGMYFANVSLPGADISNVNLEITNLDGADLSRANIGNSLFTFAQMKAIRATQADATRSRFYFAQAQAGRFDELKGQQTNWQAASLRGASFKNADLQGASFLSADLRDADFSGANLRGAFFIGSLISGAKFDNAQLANTDFSGALGSIDQFSAAQRAGLCGSDNYHYGSYHYRLRRFDEAAAIGSRYRELYSNWVLQPSGWRFLDACATRTLMTAGVAPIWNRGALGESLTEQITLQFTSKLLDSAHRSERVVAAATAILAAYNQEAEKGGYVTLHGKRYAALTDALVRNVRNAKLTSEPKFDSEAVFLYRVKFRPQTLNDDYWSAKAKQWLDRENGHRFSPTDNQWPQFFPTGTLVSELSPEHFDSFRQWTVNRAQQFPTRLSVSFPSKSLDGIFDAVQREATAATTSVDVLPVAAYFKEHPISPGLAQALLQEGAARADVFYMADSLVGLGKPLDSFAIQVPRKSAAVLKLGPPTTAGMLDVRGVRILSPSQQDVVVLDGQLSELRVQFADGSRVPP